MVLFKVLRKYLAAFYLVMFFASASFAATNGPGLPSDTIAQTMPPTSESTINTSLGIDSRCFTGYFTNSRSASIDLEHGGLPVGLMNDCFKESTAIALHKDRNKIIWSLAPSFSKFSFNPLDDIKNLQVMVQYSFWF